MAYKINMFSISLYYIMATNAVVQYQAHIVDLINKNILVAINKIRNKYQIQLSYADVMQHIIVLLKRSYNLQAFVINMARYIVQGQNNTLWKTIMFDTIQRKNALGKMLLSNQKLNNQQMYISHMTMIGMSNFQKVQTLVRTLLSTQFANNILNSLHMQREQYLQCFITYISRFRSFQIKKPLLLASQKGYIYQLQIDNQLNLINNQQSPKMQMADMIYAKYINNQTASWVTYQSYQIIQNLVCITNEQFNSFNITDEDQMQQAVKSIHQDYIENVSELNKYIVLSKLLNYSQFVFINNFQIDYVPDSMLVKLFQNVENKLQLIYGCEFMIVKCVNNQEIMKYSIVNKSENNIEQLLTQFQNNNIYDIVLIDGQKKVYSSLSDIRIRYLNYLNSNRHDNFQIFLNHPENLVSANLHKIQVKNINKCVNLVNLYTEDNKYTYEQINNLTKLKRFFSQQDIYYNDKNCMLKDLFDNNKLIYVKVNKGINITAKITISQNIQEIRFLDVEQIQLDITQLFTKEVNNLYDYYVNKYVCRLPNSKININIYNPQEVRRILGDILYSKIQNILLLKQYFNKQNRQLYFLELLFEKRYNTGMTDILKSMRSNKVQYLIQYISYFKNPKLMKHNVQNFFQKISNISSNWKYIKQYTVYCLFKQNQYFRDRTILALYEKHNNCQLLIKHDMFNLIQYIMTINETQFLNEFMVNSNDQIQNFITHLIKNKINSNQDLLYKVLISRHLKCSQIDFNFKYAIEQAEDTAIENLFEDISNRLQCIMFKHSYLLIKRNEDNKIYKVKLDYYQNEGDALDWYLSQLDNGKVYDVVVYQQYLKLIEGIKIRYLNYIGSNCEIQLKYPAVLVTATLGNMKITNLSQCVNLQNLYTWGNTYKLEDIQNLCNIKRFHSRDDKFENAMFSMIQILFERNKLEYVFVQQVLSGFNIVSDIRLSRNIKNLQFFFINDLNNSYEIILSLFTEFPANLQVFMVQSGYYNFIYGKLDGPQIKINELKQQLIHSIGDTQKH